VMWIPQEGVTADVEIRHVSIFFNQVKDTYLLERIMVVLERIMVVDSKRSFATSNWTFYSPDFFSLGDMVILMLDKLMANVIIHSRLRDRFGSILPQYDCNLISISITFHRRRVVDETRQIRIAVGQVRIYLHEIGKIQSKAQSSSVTPTRFRTLTTPKKKTFRIQKCTRRPQKHSETETC
jgi:hypothetical protein